MDSEHVSEWGSWLNEEEIEQEQVAPGTFAYVVLAGLYWYLAKNLKAALTYASISGAGKAGPR